MGEGKRTEPTKAKKLPAYDVDFRSRFGINISPCVAEIFRCKECHGYLYPLRREMWACKKMLCGKLVPKSHLIGCLIEVRNELRQYSLINLLDAVAKDMPE